MNRYVILLSVALYQVIQWSASAHAGEFFERNNPVIDSYDPVAYFAEHQPVKWSFEFRSDYHGSTFQFVSAAHRDAFVANPDKFVPQYGEYCAYEMVKGYRSVIDQIARAVVSGKLYLNDSESVHSRWLSDIPGYVQRADANWPEVEKQTKVRE